MRLRPPDLIIQDELHLISDALGSMVGLYETAIDRLSSRGPIRPVLVASTATVRRARDQVEQVFARGLTVFPPPVLDAGETYFSATVPPSPSTPGRRYRGILAPGERLKSVEIRVASALMEHAQFLFDRYGAAADPYMTLVDYFTATRELAGMRRLVEDDITDRLRSQQVRTRRRRADRAGADRADAVQPDRREPGRPGAPLRPGSSTRPRRWTSCGGTRTGSGRGPRAGRARSTCCSPRPCFRSAWTCSGSA